MIARRFPPWLVASFFVALAVSALAALYDSHGRGQIIEAEMRANSRVTPSLVAALWPHFGTTLAGLETRPASLLGHHPDLIAVEEALGTLLAEQPGLLEIRLITAAGRTLASTLASEVGRENTGLLGGLAARNGRAYGRLTADQPWPTRGDATRLDLVTGILPLYFDELAAATPAEARPDLVIALVSDVSQAYTRHRARLFNLVVIATTLLGLTVAAILVAAHRAARRVARAERANAAREQAARLDSLRDQLTGLPNRMALTEHLGRRPASGSATVLCINLDHFKLINDSLGPAVGDRLLEHAARRLETALAEQARIYRLGSDEFVAIAEGLTPGDTGRIAEAVLAAFAHPFEIDGNEIAATASVGAAHWPVDHADLEQVLGCADLAVIAAKRAATRRWASFEPVMRTVADEKVALMTGLRRARDQQQFVLHYQPRLGGRSLEVECVEALLRWQHPEEGLLPPARFIEALEDSPLILDVGRWVLATACAQAVHWHQMGLHGLRVSVNVAARQFNDDDFPATVASVLKETGLDPALLELELTETQLITDAAQSLQRIEKLKNLGLRLSIDDFGTGYSALSYLQRLPIDCLKIDRSFVREVHHARDGQIARAIAALAHGLGLTVVAEGVETEAQAVAARHWGCEQLQGFLYSPPVASEAIPALVNRLRQADGQQVTI